MRALAVAGRNRYGATPPEAASVQVAPPAAHFASKAVELLTPGQIRAARGLTGLSKDELAALANVSVSTLNRLEDAACAVRPRADTLLAVRRALEAAGVEFIFEPGKKPGLREA
jgi:DNA-binding transcriptional regulator YiaG